jgi:hypothetical protein
MYRSPIRENLIGGSCLFLHPILELISRCKLSDVRFLNFDDAEPSIDSYLT